MSVCATMLSISPRLQQHKLKNINFRKGLRYQRERCERELRNAVGAATANSLAERLQCILHTQDLLDNHGVMVSDNTQYAFA